MPASHAFAGGLGMFAKYWAPGAVKSRLAVSLGNEAASRLYQQFVQVLVTRFADFSATRIIAYSPEEQRAAFEAIAGSAWTLQPQGEGDLGTRMARFFTHACGSNERPVVLIGSDSPTLPRSAVSLALNALQGHDVVLGPAHDGGYYLIGMRRVWPELFTDNIVWSSTTVLEQTLVNLRQAGVSYHLLPAWYDVDDLADLQRLMQELREEEDPVYAKLRQELAAALAEKPF